MKTLFAFGLSILAQTTALAAPLAKPDLALASFSTMADRVGNGGFAYVCRDKDRKITQARLLDLWETPSLLPFQNDIPVHTQVETALKKLKAFSPNTYSMVGYYYDSFKNQTVKTSRELAPTDDAFPPYVPEPNCKYEQVARFEPILSETGESGLRINSEIYDSPLFSNSDRAALLLHEAIYLVNRLQGNATHSQLARTLTAHLMSESTVPNSVRMLFYYLIVEKNKYDANKIQIMSVADPMDIEVKFSVWEIDGIAYPNASSTSELYRCKFAEMKRSIEEKIGDTGYELLKDLLSYNPQPTTATMIGQEHDPMADGTIELDRLRNSTTLNQLLVQCYKKQTHAASDARVSFKGMIHFKNTQCLDVRPDGTVLTHRESDCDIYFERTENEDPVKSSRISLGIVRGL